MVERFRSVVGIPLHLALIALLVTVLLGLQLAYALDTGTSSRVRTGSTSIDGPAGPVEVARLGTVIPGAL